MPSGAAGDIALSVFHRRARVKHPGRVSLSTTCVDAICSRSFSHSRSIEQWIAQVPALQHAEVQAGVVAAKLDLHLALPSRLFDELGVPRLAA
jgi:hypothetical protein